ncbi:syntaxin-7 [Frankliniella occidentalis]|uniref:Syntaxin-7 n=1 Tax=Frankliniella occidentalis TaxID=133901 RepID=A0A6J1T4B2_FRAOC|nr:syntaxin-7 [Frankliniella occidentalis]
MDQGLAGSGNQRRYGATDGVPAVSFAGGLAQSGLAGGGLAGGGLAGDSNVSQFSPTELFNLCENITTNIYKINNGRKEVERELRSIGTFKDTQGLRDQIHNTHVSCNELIKQTTHELARHTEVVRRGNRQQKLQAERLREEFSQAVTNYCSAQKQISEKMKLHIPAIVPGSPDVDATEDESERLLAMERRQQEQKLKQRELEFESGLMEERVQRIQAIENDIIDVNQIMRELSAMVHQQGETVGSIEDNIENVHGNVELGRQELQKAAGYQNKYRRKILCLLVTAIIIATVLGIIIYVSVKR